MEGKVSLADRDGPRPITIDIDNTPDFVLPFVVLIIFVIFFGYMLYLLIASGFSSSNENSQVSTDNRILFSFKCPEGQCATNIQSGIKLCPIGKEEIEYNPEFEVCNSQYVCDNPLTPFAVLSDQSTNINGVCDPNTQCKCLKYTQCADYILSIFTTSNGNPYELIQGQRIVFPQEAPVDTPIRLNTIGSDFCTVSTSWLPFSNPGCNFISNEQMTYSELVTCMGLSNGCFNVTSSPCLQGTLAAISSNPDSLTQESINTIPFGCVRGNPCPCGQIAIFDTNFGGITCRELK